MKTPVFVSFCLIIVAALASMHAFFKDSFSPADRLRQQLTQVEKSRRAADFRALLLAHQLADYQQHVATLLPDAIKTRNDQEAFPLRQLASVAAGGAAETIRIERASGVFESAKLAFRDRDFEEANHLLSGLISRFPESAHVAEAHFLLAESQYQLKEYPSSAGTIEKMIDLFPENELTGFALLRLGHIYEGQDRIEDAGDIYRAVLANFKQPELVRQAKQSLQAVSL